MKIPGATPRWSQGGGLLVLLPLLAACATTPPEPPLPDLSGNYTGNITILGDAVFGSLAVVQEGAALDLTFSFPDIGVTARGEGTLTDSGFQAEASYAMTCPGTAVFSGELEEESGVLRGTFQATDCDGTMDGSFRFTRRP